MTGPGNGSAGASEVGLEAGWRLVQKARDQRRPVQNDVDVEVARRNHEIENLKLTLKFRRAWGWFLMVTLSTQLLIADVVFVVYLVTTTTPVAGYVMSSWLGAAVVQVVGLAWIVVRSLFPPKPPDGDG